MSTNARSQSRPPPPSWRPPPLPKECELSDFPGYSIRPAGTTTSPPAAPAPAPRTRSESPAPAPKSTSTTVQKDSTKSSTAPSKVAQATTVTSQVREPRRDTEPKRVTAQVGQPDVAQTEKVSAVKKTADKNVQQSLGSFGHAETTVSPKASSVAPSDKGTQNGTTSNPSAKSVQPIGIKSATQVEAKPKASQPTVGSTLTTRNPEPKKTTTKIEPVVPTKKVGFGSQSVGVEATKGRPFLSKSANSEDSSFKNRWNPRSSSNGDAEKPQATNLRVSVEGRNDAAQVKNGVGKAQDGDGNQNGGHESQKTEVKNGSGNEKPATIEELSSAIKLRLKDKSVDPLSGVTRLDQCLLLASSKCTLRSVRFDELSIKCLVKTFCSQEPTEHEQDGIETINVVLNPENAWSLGELEQQFNQVADAIHRIEHRGGVVLIQSTSDNKGTRPRKLRLNLKATSADEADSDALAGALGIAFLIKHRRLSLESALEIIKARRPDMKPSSALTLQLLEFEKKIRGSAGLSNSKLQLWKQWFGTAIQNWIPLTIYVLVLLIIIKCIYEAVAGTKPDEFEELVCK